MIRYYDIVLYCVPMFEVLSYVARLVRHRPDAVPGNLLQVLERLGRLQPVQPGQHIGSRAAKVAVGGTAWED